MSQKISVVDQPVLHVLEVTVETSMFKIPKVLGEWFPRINRHIDQTGAQRAGAPYARYMNINWDEMRDCGMLKQMWFALTRKQLMCVGMAVSEPATGEGDIQPAAYAAGQYLQTIHRGPYHKVGATYKLVVQWAREQGLTLAGMTQENYINDPTEVEAKDIETRILIPVLS